jgi:23S rRNA-/tRNA-specific pseudouridylate synthase
LTVVSAYEDELLLAVNKPGDLLCIHQGFIQKKR